MKWFNILFPSILALSFAAFTAPAGYAEEKTEQIRWNEKTSDHFIVRYLEDASFAEDVSDLAEQYYKNINSDLGMDKVVKAKHLSFWLWDDRCIIYLYRNQEEYVGSTGAPAWSGGFVKYKERIIHSYAGAETFLNSVLPHEMAHILFREFVGFDNPEVPLWLDEGVAQYAEPKKREAALTALVENVKHYNTLKYIRFSQLNKMRLGGAPVEVVQLFYAQAISTVHYLITDQGKSRFVDFCANLRDGYPVDRALSFATGSEISSLDDLEDGWKSFMMKLVEESLEYGD